MSVEWKLPLNTDPRALFDWARSLVDTLRRNVVTITERVTVVETATTETAADDAATITALEAYATDVQGYITAAGGFAQSVYDEYEAAAAAGQAKLASHYLTEAANRVEQKVRIDEDGVLSSSISTVSASLGTTQANLTSEISARVDGDNALASSISTVQSQANGNSASITTIQSSVDGISAQWGVSLDLNGHVAGLVRMDAGATGSTMTVVADKFIISHPSASGTLITPFVVGLVGGVSTVGISGSLVVDGSILARHIAAGQIDASKINVSSLSAIAANVGTITAGVLRSSDSKFVIDLNNKTITITT